MSSTGHQSVEDAPSEPYAEAKRRVVRAFDAAYVADLLKRTRGNRSAAARLARLDRANFKRLERRVLPRG